MPPYLPSNKKERARIFFYEYSKKDNLHVTLASCELFLNRERKYEMSITIMNVEVQYKRRKSRAMWATDWRFIAIVITNWPLFCFSLADKMLANWGIGELKMLVFRSFEIKKRFEERLSILRMHASGTFRIWLKGSLIPYDFP